MTSVIACDGGCVDSVADAGAEAAAAACACAWLACSAITVHKVAAAMAVGRAIGACMARVARVVWAGFKVLSPSEGRESPVRGRVPRSKGAGRLAAGSRLEDLSGIEDRFRIPRAL